MIAAVAVVVGVIVVIAAAIFFMWDKDRPGPIDPVPTTEPITESNSTIESSSEIPQPEPSPNAELLAEWQSEIDAEKYQDVMQDIISRADALEDDERDTAGKLLEKALDKEHKAVVIETNTYVSKEDYASALELLREAVNYDNELAASDFAKQHIDSSALEEKYESVYASYETYLQESGKQYAANCDQGRIDSMFRTADEYFEGEAYEQFKVQIYTELVFANISALANKSPEEAVSYIGSHVELTDYNCLVIENLDFFRSQMNLESISNRVSHVTSDGYILSYSDSVYLSEADLDVLSQFELYLAYFEIYARHGRKFSDPAVNNYFSQYGWYTPSIEPGVFDENSLNEYEKANVKLIYEYQRRWGYR